MRDGRPVIEALIERLAGEHLARDPQYGVVKTLRLDFSYRGERRQVEIPEGGSVMFPSDAAHAPDGAHAIDSAAGDAQC